MRVGDVIINPYVSKDFDGKLNPMYATIYLGDNKSLDYKGRVHTWADRVYRHDNKNEWRVIGRVNLKRFIEGAVLKDAVLKEQEHEHID